MTARSEWSEVLAAAGRDGAAGTLAMLCVAGDDIVADHVFSESVEGRPGGRPARWTVRRAAALILGSPESTPHQRVIGLIARYASPRRGLTAGARFDLDLAAFRNSCEEAVVAANALGAPELIGWAHFRAGKAAYGQMSWDDAIAHLESGAACLEHALASASRPPGTIAAAAGRPSWLPPPETLLRTLVCKCLHLLCRVAESTGRYDFWAAACERFRRQAEPLIPARASLYSESLMHRAAIARAQGDRDAFRRLEAELGRVFPDEGGLPHPEVIRMRMGNAEALRDWDRVVELAQDCIGTIAARAGSPFDVTPPPPAEVQTFVAGLHAAGARHRLIAVGNAAYALANAGYRNCSTVVEPAAWLDVAEACWHQIGMNAPCAVQLSRLRLLARDLEGTELDLVIAKMVDVSRIGLRYALRRNAALDAARLCRPGDTVPRDRLREMLKADPGAGIGHPARLHGALALWQFRAAEAAVRTPKSVQRWRRVEKRARLAAVELERQGTMIDPELAAECWHAAASAAAHLGAEDDDRRLELLVNAVNCVAQRLASLSTQAERGRAIERSGPIFEEAAELALRRDHAAALDFVLEASRRDRVGVLLANLSKEEVVSATVRSAAEQVQATSVALHGSDAAGVFTATLPVCSGDRFGRSAEALAHRRQRAITRAEQVIGPLVAQADVKISESYTAAQVLRDARPAGQFVILQFAPAGRPAGGRLEFYRRLSWQTGDGTVGEESVRIAMAADLVNVDASRPDYFAARRLEALGALLLPQQLRAMLAKPGTDPVRLVVVPTGLFHVPFEALPLDEDSCLVDRAVLSLHSSLSTAASLVSAEPSATVGAVTTYDPSLKFAAAELAALRKEMDVEEANTREALETALGRGSTAYEMLVLGLHGDDDHDGWGQTKCLPDGTSIAAADVLGWTVPPLCVLASCHSSIKIRPGGELAGFPLALFLRGAKTVIGGLYAIEDEATSQILSLFWRCYAETHNPVLALHAAKTEWLAADPDRRRYPRRWAGLIVYGGAQH